MQLPGRNEPDRDQALKNDRFLRALRREPVDAHAGLADAPGRALPARIPRHARARPAASWRWRRIRSSPAKSRCSRSSASTSTPRSCSPTSSPFPTRWAWACISSTAKARSSSARCAAPPTSRSSAVPDMEVELRYVMDAVRLIRRELDGRVPLIGFSGSPWTLACYMVEGGGSDNFARIKAMALQRAGSCCTGCWRSITDAVIAYLAAQRAAGAQALQVFDTWGGVLAPHHYREFSLRYLQRSPRELQRGEGAAAHAADPVRQGQRALPGGTGRQRRRRRRRRLAGRRWTKRAAAPAAASRCRATSIRRRCTVRPTRSARKSRARSTATAARPAATCSTSATACRRTWIPGTSRCWSTPCMSSARAEAMRSLTARRIAALQQIVVLRIG